MATTITTTTTVTVTVFCGSEQVSASAVCRLERDHGRARADPGCSALHVLHDLYCACDWPVCTDHHDHNHHDG